MVPLLKIKKMEKKFLIFKKYEEQIPGIKKGLTILRNLNDIKSQIDNCDLKLFNVDEQKLSKEQLNLRVDYYDFEDNKFYNLSLLKLNLFLVKIYNDDILFETVILNNKLYWIFCHVYDKLYRKHLFRYKNDMFNMHDVIRKFIHNLRKNDKFESWKFLIKPVIEDFHINYFDTAVSTDEFNLFIADFILDLCEEKVITYNSLDNSITFNDLYEKDLSILINTSFNLMILGENLIFNVFDLTEDDVESHLPKLCLSYNDSNQYNKNMINDSLVSLVISSSVNFICAEEDINNIFIEKLKNGITNNTN